MNQFKPSQVIMLPTENKNQGIYLSPIPSINKIHYWDKRISNSYIAQHLYIVSDDEIKEGDWTIFNNKEKGTKYSLKYSNDIGLPKFLFKKIIATTDTSLLYNRKQLEENGLLHKDEQSFYKSLPQPSQQFIDKYIEAYNKVEIITDVLVEYELHKNSFVPLWITKINPKDNTITIKKLKDSWNREEVFALITTFNNAKVEAPNIVKWFEENL